MNSKKKKGTHCLPIMYVHVACIERKRIFILKKKRVDSADRVGGKTPFKFDGEKSSIFRRKFSNGVKSKAGKCSSTF